MAFGTPESSLAKLRIGLLPSSLAGSFKLRTCHGSYIFWPTLIEMDDQRVLSSCEDVATVSASLLRTM